eukprot:TRINITY_DN1268_c0_g1_i1.p1 TRINITY_DN1268_c0_g1~~TRINITY_DN1268_c0_g1_i1.p1  ORF type:complete len:718 (-),score=217.82 TRINITY_DN1268_c0_g1_i1:57-2210(-)
MNNDITILIEDLHVSCDEREILHGINLTIKKGEVHVLFGSNGSGKSTLLNAIMGTGDYTITKGRIVIDGVDVTSMTTDQRARAGVGMMFQRPPTIPGLKLERFCSFLSDQDFSEFSSRTNTSKLLHRDINGGLSGGEIKRSETLQLLLQNPSFLMLDEPESGVDVENIELIGNIIADLLNSTTAQIGFRNRSALIITHTGHILDYIDGDVGHVMDDGMLRCSGNPRCILRNIKKGGYRSCSSCTSTNCRCRSVVSKQQELIEQLKNEPIISTKSTEKTVASKSKPIKLNINDDSALNFAMDTDSFGLADLSKQKTDFVKKTGITLDLEEEHPEIIHVPNANGVFLQTDNSLGITTSQAQNGIEIIPMAEAIEKYDFVREKLWTLVDKDKDDVTKHVYEQEQLHYVNGYCIIAHPGAQAEFPVQANLHMDSSNIQVVHNILIACENSKLHVVSGCTCGTHADGSHYGISEFFVGKNASLSFTMIHAWNEKIDVKPRSVAVVDDEGHFMSNYVCLAPVKHVNMYPTAHLNGKNAKAHFSSIMVTHPDSVIDAGSRIILNGEGTSGQISSRGISLNNSKNIMKAHIIGNGFDCSGHVECQGLIMKRDTFGENLIKTKCDGCVSQDICKEKVCDENRIVKDGVVLAIPQIDGNLEGCELSHEASVGRIGKDKITYLMSRGLTEDQATAAIVRGFLEVAVPGIPPLLQKEIDRVIDAAASGF